MEENLEILWQQALQTIQVGISKATFLTLFKPTRLVSLTEEEATISAPSTMVIDMLQKRFLPEIKEALRQHAGKTVELVFIVKTVAKEKQVEEGVSNLFSTIKPEPKIVPHLPRVRHDYTFETLAVSSSNQLAFASATTVASSPGTAYNPLFIYGPVGVGKTHLMHAIANEVYKKNPDSKIVYITSEEFTNEVVEAIRSNNTAKMKQRFRTTNLLIIDDIQFIAGKDRVQEELFHTFNILIDQASQIVLSSDRPPHEIKKLEARLSSRFAGGLTVDVESPDFELRTAILLKKAEKFGYPLSIDLAKEIAEKATDARSLEGLLLRIITEAQAKGGEITADVVKKASFKKEGPTHLHTEDIIQAVCEFYTVKPTQLKGPKRDASLVKARQVAMYLLKKELGLTFVEIGNVLGGRDHTTVMHGTQKVENLLKENQRLSVEISGITKQFPG